MTKIIALTGKGGVGKTSLSAMLVKILVRRFPDKKVLAIDADPSVGLATALGISPGLTLDDVRTDIIRTVEDGDSKTALELVSESRYRIAGAITEKDGFGFLAIGRPESKGCYCRINAYLKNVIETISCRFDYVVIDGEAGIEQINRRVMERVSHLLLVSDASKKGMEVMKSIAALAKEAVSYDRIGCVFNRIEDPSLVSDADTGGLEVLGIIPSDPSVSSFDASARDFMGLPEDSPALAGTEAAMERFGIFGTEAPR